MGGLFVSREGPVGDVLASKGVAYRGIPSLHPVEVRKVVRDFRPDLIHAHDYRASLVASCTGVPTISHLHNNYPWAQRLGPITLAYRMALPRFRRVIAVSPSVINEHVFSRALRKKSLIIGNGVDFADIRQNAAALRVDPIDLVFVGRLTPQKDPLTFIRIVKALQRPGRPVKAAMLGDGELQEECRTAIAANGLEDVLDLRGYVDNPYPYIAGSKLCILPSQWEGFGLVAIEAMTLRSVVLGRPVGGLKNILRQVSPELLCNSCGDFIRVADDLLTNDIKRTLIANRAQAIVKDEFSLSNFVDQIDQAYKTEMGEGPSH